MQNEIKKLDEQIAELTAKRDSLLKGGKRWRAEDGEKYYYPDIDSCEVYEILEDGSSFDCNRHKLGSYFKTKYEAQRALDRMIATQQLKDRIAKLNAEQGWVADWSDANQDKFFPSFNYLRKELCSKSSWTVYVAPAEFACSIVTLVKIKEEMPEQIKLWLGVV